MSPMPSLHDSAPPDVAVEIASGRVSAASLEMRGGQPVVAAHATEPLPDGALVPGLTAHNIRDRASVLAALNPGGYGELVTEPGQIRGALERAVASNTVACVNVMLDPEAPAASGAQGYAI